MVVLLITVQPRESVTVADTGPAPKFVIEEVPPVVSVAVVPVL